MEPTSHDEFDDLIGSVRDAIWVVVIVLLTFSVAALIAWWSL